jgi:hypothetical protein
MKKKSLILECLCNIDLLEARQQKVNKFPLLENKNTVFKIY